jgi:hypothetical protein
MAGFGGALLLLPKSFSVLNTIKGMKVGTGGVVCMYDKCVCIDESNVTIPVMYL